MGFGLEAYASDFVNHFPYVGIADTDNTLNWFGRMGMLGYYGGGEPMAALPSKLHWPVFRCPTEAGSRFGADGVFLNGDAEEGITNYDGFRHGSSYAINRNLSPGPASGGLFIPRRGYYDTDFRPNTYGYTAAGGYAKDVYNRSDLPVVMDIADYGMGWGPAWFESTIDQMCYINPTHYYDKVYSYAFRHTGEGAQIWYLDGHVATRQNFVKTYDGSNWYESIVYRPLFAD